MVSHQLQGDSSYNIPFALRLDGVLNEGALEQALSAIVNRHEVLRTRFPMRAGRVMQEILVSRHFKLAHLDLSGVEENHREAMLAEQLQSLANHRFDLAGDLPLEIRLIRLAPDQHVLAGVVHHIAFDGWSSGVFLRELAALYTAFIESRPTPLTPLAFQYADVALWQRGLQADPDGSYVHDLAYWRATLADTPELLDLPTDRPRSAMRQRRAGRVPIYSILP